MVYLLCIHNTLVPHDAPADERAKKLFKRLDAIGMQYCFTSNNKEARVKAFFVVSFEINIISTSDIFGRVEFLKHNLSSFLHLYIVQSCLFYNSFLQLARRKQNMRPVFSKILVSYHSFYFSTPLKYAL